MTDFSKTEINVDKKDYSNYRILIVSTSWNREVIDVMQEDAISELKGFNVNHIDSCLLYTSPSPRDRTRSRMPSSA